MMEPRQSTTVPNTSKASAFTSSGPGGRAAKVIGVHRNSRLRIQFGFHRNSYYARAFGLHEGLQLEKSTVGKVCRRFGNETFRHTIVTKLMDGEHVQCQPW